MKNLFYILLFGLISARGYGQVVAIQADKMNILYMCVPNPLTIAVENTSSKSLVVTTDNGEIHPDSFGRKGTYTMWPEHAGTANIYVKRKAAKGLKTVGHGVFRVKYLPMPVPKLSGKKGGEISKTLLCRQIAPSTGMENFDFSARFQIQSFTVIVTRRNREIFRRIMSDENGARIDRATNDFFHKLHNKDKVIFSNILIKNYTCFSSNILTDSMVFTVTDAHNYHKPLRRPKHGEQIRVDPITGQEVKVKW